MRRPYVSKAYFLAHAKHDDQDNFATDSYQKSAGKLSRSLLPPFEEQRAHRQASLKLNWIQQLSALRRHRRRCRHNWKALERIPAALSVVKHSAVELSQRPTFRTRKANVASPHLRHARGRVFLHRQPPVTTSRVSATSSTRSCSSWRKTHVGLDLGGVYYRDKWGPHEGLDFYRLNGRGQWAEKRDVFHLRKRQEASRLFLHRRCEHGGAGRHGRGRPWRAEGQPWTHCSTCSRR